MEFQGLNFAVEQVASPSDRDYSRVRSKLFLGGRDAQVSPVILRAP